MSLTYEFTKESLTSLASKQYRTKKKSGIGTRAAEKERIDKCKILSKYSLFKCKRYRSVQKLNLYAVEILFQTTNVLESAPHLRKTFVFQYTWVTISTSSVTAIFLLNGRRYPSFDSNVRLL